MRSLMRFAFTAGCLVAGINGAASQSGLALVQEHCSMCHAIGSSDKSPHANAPPLNRVGEFYNLDQFAEMLQAGRLLAPHSDMPAFKFTRSTAIAITNYLRSIQK